MLKKILIVLIIGCLVLFTFVMNTMLLTNRKIIDFVLEDFSKNKDDYFQIVTIIDKLPISKGRPYTIYRPHSQDKLSISCNDFYDATYVDSLMTKLRKFITRSDYSYVIEQNILVSFKCDIRNSEFVNARLIYFYNETENINDRYSGLEIGSENNIPLQTSNWIYIIDKNWIIYLSKPFFLNKEKVNFQ